MRCVNLTKLPSGSWRVAVKHRGLRRTATRPTRKEAKQLGHEFEAELGATVTPSKMTVADLLGRWYAQADLAVTYRADVDRIIDRLPESFTTRRIATVKPGVIAELYANLRTDGWTAHRIVRAHTVLSSAWTLALEREWAVVNPLRAARKPAVPRTQLHPPTPGQIAALLAAAGERFELYLLVSSAIGARRGEVVGLQWADITDDAIIVRRSLAYAPGKGVVITEGKTGPKGHRVVAIDPLLAAGLAAHREAQTELADASQLPAPVWVFSHDAGVHPWRPEFASVEFRRLRRRIGLGDTIRLHDLRHYVATQLLAAGVPLAVVGKRLGHRQLSTTSDTYGDYVPAADQAAAAVMAEIRRAARA